MWQILRWSRAKEKEKERKSLKCHSFLFLLTIHLLSYIRWSQFRFRGRAGGRECRERGLHQAVQADRGGVPPVGARQSGESEEEMVVTLVTMSEHRSASVWPGPQITLTGGAISTPPWPGLLTSVTLHTGVGRIRILCIHHSSDLYLKNPDSDD